MFFPYLGDYVRLLSVGRDFYGIFSGSNVPDLAHFPSGVSYQRNADWPTQRLIGLDGVSTVSASIDPFFFKWAASWATPIIPPGPPVIPRTIIGTRTPIVPRTIFPIFPIQPPIIPRLPPIGPIQAPEPPTELDL